MLSPVTHLACALSWLGAWKLEHYTCRPRSQTAHLFADHGVEITLPSCWSLSHPSDWGLSQQWYQRGSRGQEHGKWKCTFAYNRLMTGFCDWMTIQNLSLRHVSNSLWMKLNIDLFSAVSQNAVNGLQADFEMGLTLSTKTNLYKSLCWGCCIMAHLMTSSSIHAILFGSSQYHLPLLEWFLSPHS